MANPIRPAKSASARLQYPPIVSGTRPTFYLIPVTHALSTAVATRTYPAAETVVSVCITPPPPDSRSAGDGPAARAAVLAFKAPAKCHWEDILDDL
ncbi:hypothetical protein FB451DRAFT_1390749 [Mycena latifolia]|nr:hypothetical protein FB451DRAFT_1393284 [Mycena latifolia]KAJ7487755.1 hypothetical protein FB451DRAFT_1390749 [Mycena latifolia]